MTENTSSSSTISAVGGVGLKRTRSNVGFYYAKRTRYGYDENGQQVVPSLESCGDASSASPASSLANDEDSCPAWLLANDATFVVPKPGTPVDRKVLKRVGGKFLLGPKIGNGPVECITQYLARRENTDQFFHLKMLVLDADPQCKKTVESEKQAKLLLHSEYQLLKMLENEEGVIRAYDLFMDSAFEEEPVRQKPSEYVYTGRVKRRIVLVVDCLAPHDFDDKSNAFINLQQYVIREKNLSETKTLLVFYEIIKIVENLHKKNIVHRDLKLRNIILNTATSRVVITNFCLGKQLLNENDYLHDQRGSPAYISPDVLSASHQKPYKGKPSDIWALGVVLFTMLYSQFPFFETKPAALFKRIKSVDYKIPKHTKVSEGTQYLIKNMLLLNPDARLTATEIREQIERMISSKRQFFLRIDQMVPEIDVDSRQKDSAGEGETTTATKRLVKVGLPMKRVQAVVNQEPTFELSRERFAKQSPVTVAGIRPEGVFLLPKRDRPRVAVHRVENDARVLTGDEWGQYSGIIREHGTRGPVGTASSAAATAAGTGQSSSTMSSRLAARQNTWRFISSSNAAATAGLAPPPPPPPSTVSISQQISNLVLHHRRNSDSPTPTAAPARSAAVADDLPASPTVPRGVAHLHRGGGHTVFINPRNAVAQRTLPIGENAPNSPSSAMFVRWRQQSMRENVNQMLARIDSLFSNRFQVNNGMPLDEAARAFFCQLNEMFSRGRIPNRVHEEQVNEFNGVLTTELAEHIGDWLLQDCGESVIVRDIFAESTVNAKEKVLELLRRCGVQIEIGPTIEIKRAQSFESIMLLSYILQASGYNNSYFT